MPAFNKVIIAGNLTRDIELKYTPSGTAVTTLGIAINSKFKGKDGQWQDKTVFVDVDAWAQKAEVIAQYFTKGDPILIEGELALDTWDDQASGKKRSKLKVTLREFQFLKDRNDPEAHNRPRQTQKKEPAETTQDPFNDEDVPF